GTSGTLTWVNGGTFSTNAAAGNGGGLYVDSGTATLTSVTISANQATGATSKGGGFYLHTGSLTLNSITISGNTPATGPGGAWQHANDQQPCLDHRCHRPGLTRSRPGPPVRGGSELLVAPTRPRKGGDTDEELSEHPVARCQPGGGVGDRLALAALRSRPTA